MKILHVDVNYKHSSTGRIVDELCRAARAAGHETLALYGRGDKVIDPYAYKFGLDFETVIHAVLTRITGLTAYFSPISTYRLLKKIKSFNPDVVHLHDLHGYFVNIGSLVKYLKNTNIKVIWTFHCEFMYTGKCANTKSCKKYETQCNNCPLLHDYPKSLFLDFTRWMYIQKKDWFKDFFQLKSIVYISDWMNRKIERSFLSQYPRIKINNGIDTNKFIKLDSTLIRDLFLPNDKILILSVIGNLDDTNKGYHRLIHIANTVNNENVVFIVIGSSSNNTIELDNLIHIPRISDASTLNKYYNFCDYFMILSEYETYPTVCLEASATGTSVIGYDVGGISEAIIGVSKYLYDFHSPALIEFIDSIKSKPVKVNNRLLEKIDNSNMIDSYLNLYNEVN